MLLSRPLWRGTEAVITAPTRNRMVREIWHKGSNPFLSANCQERLRFMSGARANEFRPFFIFRTHLPIARGLKGALV